MKEQIRDTLVSLLTDIATKAKQDALADTSDIGSIYRDEDNEQFMSLDAAKVEEAVLNIQKATATKEGARRLVNGILVLAKAAAKVAFPTT